MIDQLIIGEKASFDDFEASLARRKIGQPAKKSIKQTVPFSNVTYDFTAFNGEIYWEERELEYTFEITATSPEELEEKKTAFASWIMNIMDAEIHDPFIPDYHFVGTFDDMDFEDEEGLDKTTATVKFTAYPYKVANVPKVHDVVISPKGTQTFTMMNESSHKVTPTLITDGAIMVTIDNDSYSLSAGEYTDETIKIPTGLMTMIIANLTSSNCSVSVSFCEEVF
jgi:hypothetical protein